MKGDAYRAGFEDAYQGCGYSLPEAWWNAMDCADYSDGFDDGECERDRFVAPHVHLPVRLVVTLLALAYWWRVKNWVRDHATF